MGIIGKGLARSKGRSRKLEGPKRGRVLGDGQLAPPHQLQDLGERCKLSQWGPGRSPGCLMVLLYLCLRSLLLLLFRVHFEREQ